MRYQARLTVVLLLTVTALLFAASAGAQIAEQLSAYTGDNAEGYLQPLADAFGADLNCNWYHSAHIAVDGFHWGVEFPVMGVIFSDDVATFEATTESGFTPEQTVDAPTVVGSGDAVSVDGDAGTEFTFPGGFDLNSFGMAVPQIRIGNYMGTEAIIRYFALDVGDVEIGNLSLYGFGLRHSISQYMEPDFPVDLAGGFMWQKFTLGDDFIDANAFTIGIQASKNYGWVEPYAGLSYDMFSMTVTYEGDEEEVEIDLESETSVHLTLGCAVGIEPVMANFEYNIAGTNSFGFGLSIGL
ncbi:hypothetical protein K8S17_06855 [bacterium]|nr:hypothetical protein [bacterium]